MAAFPWKSYFLPMISSGTIEGTIIVLASKDMRTLITVKKAHLGIVTTLSFSQDSRLGSSFYLELTSPENKHAISQCSWFTSFQNIAVNFL